MQKTKACAMLDIYDLILNGMVAPKVANVWSYKKLDLLYEFARSLMSQCQPELVHKP